LRKLALRLPASWRPQAENHGFIIHLSAAGEVMHTLQDPSGAYPQTTGGIVAPDGYLYVSSLSAAQLARMKLK